jgi:hypothetical protein
MPVSMSNNRPCALANNAGRKGVKWSDVETNKVLAAFESGDTIPRLLLNIRGVSTRIQSKLVALVVKKDGFLKEKNG